MRIAKAHLSILMMCLGLSCTFPLSAGQNVSSDLKITIIAPEASEPGHTKPVVVHEKNTGLVPLDASRSMDQSTWYKIEIFRDGQPVPKTEDFRRREARVKSAERSVPPMLLTLQPGQDVEFSLPISGFYDLSQPGTYEVAIERELPNHTQVKSNTVSIIVTSAPLPGR